MVLTFEQILATPDEPDEARKNLIKPDFGMRLSLPEMNLYRDLAAEAERWQQIALQDGMLRAAEMVGQMLRETEKSFSSSVLEMSKLLVNDSIIQQTTTGFLTRSLSSIPEMLALLSWRPDVGPTIIKRPTPGTFMGDVQIVSDGSIEQSEVQAALDRLIAKKFPYWRVFPGLQAGHSFQQELWPKVAKPALYEAIQDMPGSLYLRQAEGYLRNYLARRAGGLCFEALACVQIVAAPQPVQGHVPAIQAGEQFEGGAIVCGPRVPKRGAPLRRWRATWLAIGPLLKKATPYAKICDWLQKMHPELACSPDILADIIRAGEAGLLDGGNSQ